MEKWPIGVFASIDAGLGVQLEVAHELGVPTIHLHAPHRQTRTLENAKQFVDRLHKLGITITVVFGGFEGESYADIPTVVRTIGLVPQETRAARLKEMQEISDFARLLGCGAVGLHIGFVPHDPADPQYREIVEVTRRLCHHVKSNGQNLHLETGQESADTLLRFIEDVGRDNLFVNFDPANMILYGTGDPIEALRKVGMHVRSCHCKDGKWSARPGKDWGTEVRFGQGDVGAGVFLGTLKEIGYDGALTIEREIPQDPERQKAEIGQAVRVLEQLRNKILT